MEAWRKAKQNRVWCGDNVRQLEHHFDHTFRKRQIAKMSLVSKLIIGRSVLDVGCGFGHLYEYLPEGTEYLGVDQSDEMLERAKKRNPSAKFLVKNLYDLKEQQFDTVVCLDVLHHQPDLEPGFSILYKLARNCLIVTLWISDRMTKNTPRHRIGKRGEIINNFTEEELEKKFSGLKYEVYNRVGAPWKDLYRFLK